MIGSLVGVYAFCQLFSGPMLGRLSDHTGRKPLLIVSQIGTLIGFLVTASAPVLWVVFLGRIIDGCTAGNLSLAQAYISDVTKPEERAKSFGVIGIAFGLGFLIGPAISGFLAKFDYRYPMYAAALMSFTSIMATTFLLPPVSAGGPAAGRKPAARDAAGRADDAFPWSSGASTRAISASRGCPYCCSSFSRSRSHLRSSFQGFRWFSSAVSPGTARLSGRNRPATCGPLQGSWESACKGRGWDAW